MENELTFCKYCFDKNSDWNEPLITLNAGDEYWSQCPLCECIEVDSVSAVIDDGGKIVEVL